MATTVQATDDPQRVLDEAGEYLASDPVRNNAILTLLNLTVANGFSSNGAGIYNAGGTVVLSNCFLSANLALGNVAKDGKDGSSASDGTSGGAGFTGMGGGIYNQGGVVTLQRTTVFGQAINAR